MPNRKVVIEEFLDRIYEPAVIIDHKDIDARYYHDGSGEFTLLSEGNEFFHREDGRIKHHIEYIEEQIDELKKQILVCKKAASTLKKARAKLKVKQ